MKTAVRLLNKAIKEEAKAPKDYDILKRHLNPSDKKKVNKIISQERNHRKELIKIRGKYGIR